MPTVDQVKLYLAAVGTYDPSGPNWTDDLIETALLAEASDQAARVRYPTMTNVVTGATSTAFNDSLSEALMRRVAHNLALRPLTLGLQSSMSEMAISTNPVGGMDAEVKRLEAPFRRRNLFGNRR